MNYKYGENINDTGESGIINISTMMVLCICPEDNAEIILKALKKSENIDLGNVSLNEQNEVTVLCAANDYSCRFNIPDGNRCDYIYKCSHKTEN